VGNDGVNWIDVLGEWPSRSQPPIDHGSGPRIFHDSSQESPYEKAKREQAEREKEEIEKWEKSGRKVKDLSFTCRDTEAYLKCLCNAGVNLGVDFIPYLGGVKGAVGAKLDVFEGSLDIGGPEIDAAADGSGYYSNQKFNSRGGDARLDHYNDLANKNGLGRRPRAARSSLSALKTFGRVLPLVGDVMDIGQFLDSYSDCYDKHCK
jgi:hypothetical protein